ncbi:hypothetical protein GCM10011575_17500 [Microlunatus endophyticus]|uniref:Cytidyltransferase-like domain-containing protein n=1 Tax=Microlunatus endophyticus TaxID=1716077 RepID=A0A917S6J3_9ACTN|nr:hypothetical protein [Microlunatus endophyticus]GGL59438.1 hypothetical protein GCM10011575_17500 [Microlunatus endophyticus]
MICGYLACTFDLLNVGDLDVIAQARDLCDVLTVGVYSDELVLLGSGLPPVVPLAERTALLRHVRGVDVVVVHDEHASDAAADRVFTVAGDPVGRVRLDAIKLVPRRETASRELREALAPNLQRGVA